MELVGADVAFGSTGGQVLQYFPDVDRLLVQTPDGLHHLVDPREIRVEGDTNADIDELQAGHRAEVEWLQRYSAGGPAPLTPTRRPGGGSTRLRLGAVEPAALSASKQSPQHGAVQKQPPGPSGPAAVARRAAPPPRAAPLPDYSWYRDGFVRTDAIAERCAHAVSQWVDVAAAPRPGLLACVITAGESLGSLLPPPAFRGPAARGGGGAAAVSVKVSLISHPASVRRALLVSPSAVAAATSAQAALSPSRPGSANQRSSASRGPIPPPQAAPVARVTVPTAVNPLTCRRLPLFESAPIVCGGVGASSRSDFAALAGGRLQRRVCVIQSPTLPPASGLARTGSVLTTPVLVPPRSAYDVASGPAADPAILRAALSPPLLNWSCLESYLHFQVALGLSAGAAAAATAGGGATPWQPPQQQRVIGHAIVRLCDIFAGAVRTFAPGASPLYDALHTVGDAPPSPPPPLEFFVRLLIPVTPLHDDAPASDASGSGDGSSAALDVELSLVLPPGLELQPEFTQAYSRPPPAPGAAGATSQKLGVGAPPPPPAAEEQDDDGDDAAAFFLAKGGGGAEGEEESGEAPPASPPASQSQQRSPASASRLGSRWALGPGKEAREERLALALSAYSNVRGSLPAPAAAQQPAAPRAVGDASGPSAAAPARSAADVAAAAEAARTAALIRSSVAELQHSIEGIQAQLQAQTAQMSEASAQLARGSVIAAQLKAGMVAAVARPQQAPAQQQAQQSARLAPAAAGASVSSGASAARSSARGPYTTLPQAAAAAPQPRPVVGGLLAASAHLYSELSHMMHALGDGPPRAGGVGAGARRASGGGGGDAAAPTSVVSGGRVRPVSAQPQRRRP